MERACDAQFGDLLRRYRLVAGLTQEELAERARVSVRGLSDLERGLHRAPHPETVRRLVEALALGETQRASLRDAIGRRGFDKPVTRPRSVRPLPEGAVEVSSGRPQLAEPLSSFVGRQRELGALRELLSQTRLLTLTGPGGVGKTRLAVRLAQAVLNEYPDGVYVVELASLAEPELLPQMVAECLGVRERGGQPMLATLAGALGQGTSLLVLDNCEHVLEPCAGLANSLLHACPRLRMLATSREPLGLSGEVVWHVPVLPEIDAVQLFHERALAADPTFVLSRPRADAVAEVCRRLDGLPLAIELAAARTRVLAPEEVLARLVLVTGSRTSPARHQTLRAAVDWSYDLLDERDRRFFGSLSVFPGSFTLSAAEFVSRGSDDAGSAKALGALSRLVDRSLLLVERSDDAPASRYRMLETLRAYARERLLARGDADALPRRRALWTLDLAEQAERAFHGPEEDRWMRVLEHEHDNLRAALAWSTSSGEADTALRLVGALGWYDGLRGAWTEGRGWLERALDLPDAKGPSRPRAVALASAGRMAAFQGDFAAARRWLDEALALARQLKDDRLVLVARGAGVQILQFGGAVEAAEALADEMLVLARRLNDCWWEGRMLAARAGAALHRGDLGQATGLLEAGVQLARGTGDLWSLAMALSQLGDIERTRGAYARAGELYAESLGLRDRLRLGGTGAPSLWHNLGYVAIAGGDFVGAAARFTAARAEFRRLGEPRGVAESIIGLAAVAAAEGRAETAARLFGAGEAALEAFGSQLWPSNRAEYEHSVATVRAALSPEAFAAAWSAGRETWLAETGG